METNNMSPTGNYIPKNGKSIHDAGLILPFRYGIS